MSWIRGFEAETLEVLNSRNPALQREAVRAAGNWQLDAAWPRIAALIGSETTERSLLLEAIGAAAILRPEEACPFLMDLAGSEDEEIAEAANEALMEPGYDEADSEDEDEDFRP